MPWVSRGLRDGILTTPYPRRPDGYGSSYRGAVSVLQPELAGSEGDTPIGPQIEAVCPTGAITAGDQSIRLDRGRCILCGSCVEQRPEFFTFDPTTEVAVFDRDRLVVPEQKRAADPDAIERARAELARKVKALRRSVHIRHVDAGSDGAEEWEIAALGNPVYDVQRLGVFFTASPRHADLLLVTGAGTTAMAGPLRRTWAAMPEPKIVIAAGTDAISGGLIGPSYTTEDGIAAILPVDVWVPGSPPSPFSLLHAIIAAVGRLPRGKRS